LASRKPQGAVDRQNTAGNTHARVVYHVGHLSTRDWETVQAQLRAVVEMA
jgi:hypothetical protein